MTDKCDNGTDEYQNAVAALGLTLADLKHSLLTAAGASLLPPAEQAALVAQFRAALDLAAAQ